MTSSTVPQSRWQRLVSQLHHMRGEAARFFGFGVLSYALGVGLSALFSEVVGLPVKVSVALTLGILFLTNFWAARRFIFRVGGNARGQFVRFIGISLAMRMGEYGVFHVLLEQLHVYYLVALSVAMVSSGCLKFILYRTVVFRRPAEARSTAGEP